VDGASVIVSDHDFLARHLRQFFRQIARGFVIREIEERVI
jgi:hypothetical protein